MNRNEFGGTKGDRHCRMPVLGPAGPWDRTRSQWSTTSLRVALPEDVLNLRA